MKKLRNDGAGYTAELLWHSEMGERIETLTASLDQQEWAMTGDGNTR